MPQLSPLNWIFLFILFWSAFITLYVVIWWSFKVTYNFSCTPDKNLFLANQGVELNALVLSKSYRWVW